MPAFETNLTVAFELRMVFFTGLSASCDFAVKHTMVSNRLQERPMMEENLFLLFIILISGKPISSLSLWKVNICETKEAVFELNAFNSPEKKNGSKKYAG